MPEFPFGQAIAWRPDPESIERTNLAAFWKAQGLSGYDELLTWAVEDVGRFWDAALKDLGVEFYEPYTQVLDTAGGIERPAWCVGGKMNVVHNCLDKWQDTDVAGRDAIRYESEEGVERNLTYRDLFGEVNTCAAGLRALGLGKGDAVGLFLPMTPELVVAFLAVIKIGGIVLPLFSGYGAQAVATRLQDADAKALIVADALMRRGKAVPMKPVSDEALHQCPTVETVVVVERVGDAQLDAPTPMHLTRDRPWDAVMALGREAMAAHPDAARTERTSAEDSLMIIYTSGTTGRPKGAVHTHCGFPIKAAQDLRHPMDLKPGDVLWWMTDIGWMMGPWLLFGSLLNAATMVLYDGAPDWPDVDRVWALTNRHGVTHLGVSPTLIRALMAHGEEPVHRYDLTGLRAAGSTGSPWDPDAWRWLFTHALGGQKPILNYSGGTEISGGIVCGNFLQPLKPCGFSGPIVGMDADVVDEAGQPVRGAVGELILRQPWIGMTRGFWKDDGDRRYHDTYWSQLPGVWVHGDFAAIDADGVWYILGRSDDTIKVAGKRVGPSEVEAVLNAHPRVLESAAVGVPHPLKDQEIVAFCVPAPGIEPDEAMRADLVNGLVEALGKPLKPRGVFFVDALPKTRNAKVMRRVIRAAHLGEPLGDVTSLENPATVDAIEHYFQGHATGQ
ncbi:MAG TPA: AMP-binding protein, partial [Rubricoccaceae bacterium]|nr:AMP-binding protein [Rubricoccaceae bacterium]